MLSQSDLIASIDAYEHAAHESIRKARTVVLPSPVIQSFSTLGLSKSRIDDIARSVVTGNRKEDHESEFIYLFRLSTSNLVPAGEVLTAFNAARATQESDGYQGKKNLCRPNAGAVITKTLYVGRSYSPRERLKQHLRPSTSGTYAIHFVTWAAKIDLKVDFCLYKFSGVGDRAIQVLEDGIWDHLRPLLGRRGEK